MTDCAKCDALNVALAQEREASTTQAQLHVLLNSRLTELLRQITLLTAGP